MRKIIIPFMVMWFVVTVVGYWGLSPANQTPLALLWVALGVAAGPLVGVDTYIHQGGDASPLLLTSIALVCVAVALHAWRQTWWSFGFLALMWLTSGFVFSIGIYL
jgi:hypothetical protein